MKKVLISGGTGFVGANLAERLVKEGYDVNLLIRKESNLSRIKNFSDRLKIHSVDFLDQDELFKKVESIKAEWIFHLATHGAYSWQRDLRKIIDTNIVGSVNFLKACMSVGFDRFINAGSSSEYGEKDHAPTEEDSISPNSHYALAKAFFSNFCRFSARESQLSIVTLRLYSVFGQYEDENRLIPTLISYGIQGKLPPLVDPDIVRDFIYIGDVIDAFMLTAQSNIKELGEVFNVGSGVQTSIRSVVECACRVFGIKELPQWGSMPNRSWDTKIWRANVDKIKRELGWQAKYSFEAGFRKYVAER